MLEKVNKKLKCKVTVKKTTPVKKDTTVKKYTADEMLVRDAYPKLKDRMKFPDTLQIHSIKAATTVAGEHEILTYLYSVSEGERVIIFEYSSLNSLSQRVRNYAIGRRISSGVVCDPGIQYYSKLFTDITPISNDIIADIL